MDMTDVVSFPRDTVLTEEQLRVALGGLSEEKIRKADLPTVYFGRDRRYIWGQVLDVLAERAERAA
jgi:hypothetical protein